MSGSRLLLRGGVRVWRQNWTIHHWIPDQSLLHEHFLRQLL